MPKKTANRKNGRCRIRRLLNKGIPARYNTLRVAVRRSNHLSCFLFRRLCHRRASFRTSHRRLLPSLLSIDSRPAIVVASSPHLVVCRHSKSPCVPSRSAHKYLYLLSLTLARPVALSLPIRLRAPAKPPVAIPRPLNHHRNELRGRLLALVLSYFLYFFFLSKEKKTFSRTSPLHHSTGPSLPISISFRQPTLPHKTVHPSS